MGQQGLTLVLCQFCVRHPHPLRDHTDPDRSFEDRVSISQSACYDIITHNNGTSRTKAVSRATSGTLAGDRQVERQKML